MPQTFQQLQQTPSKEDLLSSLIALLQGVGLTSHTGFSPGGLTVTGVPAAAVTVLVRIETEGDLGAAAYETSIDDGASWNGPYTIPSSGVDGFTADLDFIFTNGPAGLTSFELGDIFTIELSVPVWPLTSWEALAAGRTLLELDAAVLEDLYALLANISKGGLVEEALGPWLDLLAESLYGLTRTPGAVTEGQVVLSDPGGVGPFNLASGAVVFESLDGLRFILSEAASVPASGSDTVLVRAESKGSVYNVGNNTITRLVTSVPGLTVNNPVVALGTWITTAGSDDESNEALVLRCKGRWLELAIGLPGANYDTWAKASDPAINRSFSEVSPTVAGQVDLYIAGAAGAVSAPVIAACQDYVDQRAALTNTVVVASVVNFAQTITAAVFVEAAYLVTATAAVIAAIEDLVNVKKGIGATLYLSELYDAIQTVTGVRNTNITVPAADVVLAADEVFVFTNDLTFTAV